MNKKPLLLIFFCLSACCSVFSQLSVVKRVGKGANGSQLGFGAFSYYDIALQQSENKSLRIELLDLAYFPPKDRTVAGASLYLSIKLGYKYIFSETRTGFYLEPQAGYCRVVVINPNTDNAEYGDGVAAALEGGYNLGVGQNNNAFTFGLKYETDRAGKAFTLNSVGLRVSFSFNLFRRRS